MEGRGRRVNGSLEGKMAEPLSSGTISTKLERVAELARRHRERAFRSIHHVIDLEWLKEAFRRVHKDAAAGVDGQTAADYAANLEVNLQSLLTRFVEGHYHAPPVRRVHIPKGDGRKTRPIGVPTIEDKVLQRAVAMLLEAIYEQDFFDCSYGFRPGRSAHDALNALRDGLMSMGGGWVLEVDIERFFDTLDHAALRSFLDRRVSDGVLRRVVHKWLKAGVMEDGEVRQPDLGTPQGGVISPLLANVFLHEVLDQWYMREVKPRLVGRSFLVRYADDFVLVFEREDDAKRVMDVLPRRFGKYGLALHPDKTRLVRFERPRDRDGGDDDGNDASRPGTFDLLGFTHCWEKSLRAKWVVRHRTARDRLARSLKAVRAWCRANLHRPLPEQQAALSRKLLGHFNYYGRRGNWKALKRFTWLVTRIWRYWLNRRSWKAGMTWEAFGRLLKRYPLPPPRIPARFRASASP